MSIKTQGILNNMVNDNCPCCDRVWIALDPQGSSTILDLYYEGFDATVTSHVWQVSATPNVWLDLQTGGITLDVNSLALENDLSCGDKIRVEYTDTQGCIHYSNLSFRQCL